jgi:hypothetical protein
MEDDGTAVRRYEWSGVELIDPDEVFSEFPSENIENIATPISDGLAVPRNGNDVRARHAWRPRLRLLLSRRSVLLASAASFVVGVVAGAAIVWGSGHWSASAATVGTAAPEILTSERPIGQARTPALRVVTLADPQAHQRMPQASPARLPLASARRISFRGSLMVYSRPSGAHVFLNGRGAGTTPLALKNQSVGSRVVRIELDGYRAWTSAVQVVTNTSTNVRADLTPARESFEH